MLIFTTSVSIYYKIRTSIITLLKETFISELVFLIAVDFPFFIVSLTVCPRLPFLDISSHMS